MKREQLFWFLGAASGIAIGSARPFRDGAYNNDTTLRFGQDGTFKIAIFEDLHYGEAEDSDWGPEQDIKSTRVINTILDFEAPNLAVLNGDLITGENTFEANSTRYLDKIVAPLVQRSIPWASTYGNHDIQFNLSTRSLLQREKTVGGKLSLTKNMVSGAEEKVGTSNYYLPLYGSEGANAELKAILWFFDSRGGKKFQEHDANGNEIQVPGFVDDAVVNWYLQASRAIRIRYQRVIPSLAFVHIPTYASNASQADPGVDPNREPGINDDNPLAPQGITNGVYTGNDEPFMKALAATEGLMGVFSGHDHGDDWCFKWNTTLPSNITGSGVPLCFGRHTGYGGYGSWTRGSRQIWLDESNLGKEVDTWIRLEDGNVSGHVVLNSTYGEDVYPAANKTYT